MFRAAAATVKLRSINQYVHTYVGVHRRAGDGVAA